MNWETVQGILEWVCDRPIILGYVGLLAILVLAQRYWSHVRDLKKLQTERETVMQPGHQDRVHERKKRELELMHRLKVAELKAAPLLETAEGISKLAEKLGDSLTAVDDLDKDVVRSITKDLQGMIRELSILAKRMKLIDEEEEEIVAPVATPTEMA